MVGGGLLAMAKIPDQSFTREEDEEDFALQNWYEGIKWIENWFNTSKVLEDSSHPFDDPYRSLNWSVAASNLISDFCKWHGADYVSRSGSDARDKFRRSLRNTRGFDFDVEYRAGVILLQHLDQILIQLAAFSEDNPEGQRWESSYGKDESSEFQERDNETNSQKWWGFHEGADFASLCQSYVFVVLRPANSKHSVLEIYLKDQASRQKKRSSGGHNAKWRLIGKPLLEANPTLSRTALAKLIHEQHPEADRSAIMHGLKPLFSKG